MKQPFDPLLKILRFCYNDRVRQTSSARFPLFSANPCALEDFQKGLAMRGVIHDALAPLAEKAFWAPCKKPFDPRASRPLKALPLGLFAQFNFPFRNPPFAIRLSQPASGNPRSAQAWPLHSARLHAAPRRAAAARRRPCT
jgi:hypothetical protein